jgi:hypothetical protein
MSKARKTKQPSQPEWMTDESKLRAEAKRQGVPGFLLRLGGGRDLRSAGSPGKPDFRRD